MPLNKPITIQGGFEENLESGEFETVGARNGETLTPVSQPGPSLEEIVDPSLLSPSELAKYEAAVASGKTKTTATVELAAPAHTMHINEGHLLGREGVALELPVEVKLTNPFLGKNCYDGSWVHPIVIHLTTGTSNGLEGAEGELFFNEGGTILRILNNSLVDGEFAVPGVTGCGTNNGADAALNSKMGVPSPAGDNSTRISGELSQAGAGAAEAALGVGG